MKVRFSLQAAQDYEDVYLYRFLNFGEKQADAYTSAIQECLKTRPTQKLVAWIQELRPQLGVTIAKATFYFTTLMTAAFWL